MGNCGVHDRLKDGGRPEIRVQLSDIIFVLKETCCKLSGLHYARKSDMIGGGGPFASILLEYPPVKRQQFEVAWVRLADIQQPSMTGGLGDAKLLELFIECAAADSKAPRRFSLVPAGFFHGRLEQLALILGHGR